MLFSITFKFVLVKGINVFQWGMHKTSWSSKILSHRGRDLVHKKRGISEIANLLRFPHKTSLGFTKNYPQKRHYLVSNMCPVDLRGWRKISRLIGDQRKEINLQLGTWYYIGAPTCQCPRCGINKDIKMHSKGVLPEKVSVKILLLNKKIFLLLLLLLSHHYSGFTYGLPVFSTNNLCI